jgi:DeoR family fructose operon transcriptional repressor
VGPLAEDFIAKLRVDKAFFGAAGVSLQRGFTDADIREAQIKRKMAESAHEINMLVDGTKFGKEAFSTTLLLEQVDRIITDHIPPEFEDHLSQLDVHVIIAADDSS